MIKGRLERQDGKTILLLGLTKENMSRLLDDQPIHIATEHLAEMGLPTDMEVLVIGGESEASISEQLGGLPLQPEVRDQKFTQRPRRDRG